MVEVNDRLKELHDIFCKDHCRHRKGEKCEMSLQDANLANCHIGEWWDLNDWIIKVEGIMALIKQQYEKEHVVDERGSLKDLKK